MADDMKLRPTSYIWGENVDADVTKEFLRAHLEGLSVKEFERRENGDAIITYFTREEMVTFGSGRREHG